MTRNPAFLGYEEQEDVLYCNLPATILHIDNFSGYDDDMEVCEIFYMNPNGILSIEELTPREFSERVKKV